VIDSDSEQLLLGIEDLRGLRHEAHAAEHDALGARLRAELGELVGVADEIRHAEDDLRALVDVGRDDRLRRFFKIVDLPRQPRRLLELGVLEAQVREPLVRQALDLRGQLRGGRLRRAQFFMSHRHRSSSG
jgi:hypothetical protein